MAFKKLAGIHHSASGRAMAPVYGLTVGADVVAVIYAADPGGRRTWLTRHCGPESGEGSRSFRELKLSLLGRAPELHAAWNAAGRPQLYDLANIKPRFH